MKPRIFVSSTFYDLKYVREDLASFIRTYNFEPILFEEGDIGYESGKPLDNSCYEAMRTSDMAILIIGGQHGTNATNQTDENSANFISITQQEFISAVQNNIPVFAFVDAKVYTEYDLYKENIEKIKKNPKHINFRATKDIRVFEFIRNIYGLGSIPVNEFSKIQDIKDFLSKQWSDMFKKYLNQCKESKEMETIKISVSKLESIVNQMSIMMDAIGKSVLDKNNEYKEIKSQQNKIIIQQKVEEFFDEFKKYIIFLPPTIDQIENFPEYFIQALNYIIDNEVVDSESMNTDLIMRIGNKIMDIFRRYQIIVNSVQSDVYFVLLKYQKYLINHEYQNEMKRALKKDLIGNLNFVRNIKINRNITS